LTRFSKSGGAFHYLSALLLNVATIGEQPYQIF